MMQQSQEDRRVPQVEVPSGNANGLGGGAPPLGSWGEDPAANPAVRAHLHSLVHATQRLWRDLRVGRPILVPHHARHSNRVALFSLRIARALGLSEEISQQIYRAAYVHDVGKIALHPSILRKTGALTVAERRSLPTHSVIGWELLRAFARTSDLAEIALSHHERYDGEGYPNGLHGSKIPLAARILAIADSLDSMLSRSTGRSKLAYSAAWTEIARQAGRQFDPCVVETLVRRRTLVGPSHGV